LLTISNSHVFELFKPFEQLNSLSNLKINHQHLIPKPANGKDKDENKKITDKPVAFPDGQLRTYQSCCSITDCHGQGNGPNDFTFYKEEADGAGIGSQVNEFCVGIGFQEIHSQQGYERQDEKSTRSRTYESVVETHRNTRDAAVDDGRVVWHLLLFSIPEILFKDGVNGQYYQHEELY